jgi:predicted RNase H-like nuclease
MHPECSFAAMNNGRPLASKRTELGRTQRTDLVYRSFGVTPGSTRRARADDVLDAYALLWSAERFAMHEHVTMPAGEVRRDATGLAMRIVV